LRTLKKQQFQQAMLKALETKDFSLEKFKANLYGSRHKFNDLAKQTGMSIEIFRIERKK
jgi:hypothetical protein